jgi:hypothetical protein
MKIAMLVLLLLTVGLVTAGKLVTKLGGSSARTDMAELPFDVLALLTGGALIVLFVVWVIMQIARA